MVRIVETPTVRTFTMTFTEVELRYLKELTCNYLGGELDDEPADQRGMRSDIWEACHKTLHNL
jgi:hypothetical protein